MVTQHPRLQPSGKPTENITHSCTCNQDTESKSEHVEKGDIGDNMRNDTKSPSKVRTSKGCYYTTQQIKMIQQEGIEPQTHLHKLE